jgi:enhancer of polycomb-like protein
MHLQHMQQDPDFLNFYKSPTSSVFETIINLLERNTGLNRDPITMVLAQKLVCSKLDVNPVLAAKLIPPVYHYWAKKRDRLSKSLSRKFWPQTQSNDTNPHHVFRARDKERYRLRKQHRRNDVESFRYRSLKLV